MAAILYAGPGSALSHLAAARHWGIRKRAVPHLDVTCRRRVSDTGGIRFHVSRTLQAKDIVVHRGIPVTSPARTLLDLGDVLTTYELANVLHEAQFVLRNRFRLGALENVMRRNPGRGAVTVLRQAIEINTTGSAGTKSGLERRFLDLIKGWGWDAPRVNVPLDLPGGALEVDFVWPLQMLVVEVDGGGHERRRTAREDLGRDARLREAHYAVVRLRAANLTRPAAVRAHLAAHFAR